MGRVQCLECDKILESKFRHDYQECGCRNATMVDGGNDYLRYGGKDMDKVKILGSKLTYIKGFGYV